MTITHISIQRYLIILQAYKYLGIESQVILTTPVQFQYPSNYFTKNWIRLVGYKYVGLELPFQYLGQYHRSGTYFRVCEKDVG